MSLERRLGENVRRWRLKRGLSQEEFAHRSDLHPTYVSGVENGRRNPTVKVIGRMAETLDVEPQVLLLPLEPQGNS